MTSLISLLEPTRDKERQKDSTRFKKRFKEPKKDKKESTKMKTVEQIQKGTNILIKRHTQSETHTNNKTKKQKKGRD